MQHALKRLLELREELERLHETTSRVLAESEQLITQISAPVMPPRPDVSRATQVVARRRPRAPKKATARRSR